MHFRRVNDFELICETKLVNIAWCAIISLSDYDAGWKCQVHRVVIHPMRSAPLGFPEKFWDLVGTISYQAWAKESCDIFDGKQLNIIEDLFRK